MKKQIATKKLSITRETLRELVSRDILVLAEIVGGMRPQTNGGCRDSAASHQDACCA